MIQRMQASVRAPLRPFTCTADRVGNAGFQAGGDGPSSAIASTASVWHSPYRPLICIALAPRVSIWRDIRSIARSERMTWPMEMLSRKR